MVGLWKAFYFIVILLIVSLSYWRVVLVDEKPELSEFSVSENINCYETFIAGYTPGIH